MQRDGNPDDRTKPAASGRTPPVIEGEAVELRAASEDSPEPRSDADRAAPASAEQEAIEPASAEDALPGDGSPTNGAGPDAISAPPQRKKRGGALAIFGILVVAAAGAVAWLAAPEHDPSGGSLKSRVIALLPESAQRALHVAQEPNSQGAPPPQNAAAPSALPAEKPDAGATQQGGAPSDAAKPPAPAETQAAGQPPKADEGGAEKTTPAEPKAGGTQAGAPGASGNGQEAAPSTNPPPPAAPGQSAGMTVYGGPPVAIGVDPARIEELSRKVDAAQAKIDALQGKLDAALGRIDEMQSRLELAQGKLDAAATADAVAQGAQRLDTLTQRLAAIEQKLEQPKTDARAPQARENNAPSGREFAASRAVVAQATADALRAGSPLADDLAALKGLGVADDKLADLDAYAKTGAPTVAQLAQQWRGLRDKVIALDAPPPGASFLDKLAARAKNVFRVTWAGQGARNSIGATVGRIDAALQKSDLSAAVAACDDFPAVAKNLVADWQTAATARLKADAAARALMSESISAIGRSSSQ